MIVLKHLLTEQTEFTKFCKKDILSKSQFSADKWSSIQIWSNRKIAGSNTTSQHATGNAIDWFGKKGVGDPVMQQLTDYLYTNRYFYNIENLIYNRLIWNEGKGWHSYNGVNPHITHVHVDFKINKQSNLSNYKNAKLINDKFQTALDDMYYVIVTNPEKYFSEYRSWNPLSKGIGDDEEGAAEQLKNAYNQLVYDPYIKKYYNNCTKSERANMDAFIKFYNALYQAIYNGRKFTANLTYYKWNSSTNKYVILSKKFVFDYLSDWFDFN